jgi:hypothetical protein
MINSTNKASRGESSAYDGISSNPIIRYGIVKALESNIGPAKDSSVIGYGNRGLGRIKVQILGSIATGGDGDTPTDELPWCFPMLPKHLQIQPKIGEAVLVLNFNNQRQHADRLYIGPIISQLPLLNNDPYFYSALNGFSFGFAQPQTNTAQIPELNGVFPNPEDISIQGRYNTEVTQKRNEVVIRAGKFVEAESNINGNPYPFRYNPTTQGFIQLKNDVVLNDSTNQQNQLRGTVANIVANKINLITHADGSPRFNVTDPDVLITDDELNRILSEAHQVPFGDVLLQYLKLLRDAFLTHVHNGSGNPPTDLTISGNKQSVAIFKTNADNLENSMLSKNVRIN